MIPQIAPLQRTAKYRQSPNSAWPLRGADGLTWAERKEKERKQ